MGEQKKCKQAGKNARKCAAYYNGGNFTHNKVRSMVKHIERNPGDVEAIGWLRSFAEQRGGVALVRQVNEKIARATA